MDRRDYLMNALLPAIILVLAQLGPKSEVITLTNKLLSLFCLVALVTVLLVSVNGTGSQKIPYGSAIRDTISISAIGSTHSTATKTATQQIDAAPRDADSAVRARHRQI
jgi:hypothetical protein